MFSIRDGPIARRKAWYWRFIPMHDAQLTTHSFTLNSQNSSTHRKWQDNIREDSVSLSSSTYRWEQTTHKPSRGQSAVDHTHMTGSHWWIFCGGAIWRRLSSATARQLAGGLGKWERGREREIDVSRRVTPLSPAGQVGPALKQQSMADDNPWVAHWTMNHERLHPVLCPAPPPSKADLKNLP